VLHANYWLSAVAAHRLKHELELPLVTTFHTLAQVKTATGDIEPGQRAEAERVVIGCSDAVCASNGVEADQLVDYYGADRGRIEIVPPGVDHAFFAPGDRRGARWALGLGAEPVLLFVGRIQPLKGLDVAVAALGAMRSQTATLVAVGGPSGAEGDAELARIQAMIGDLGLDARVRLVAPQPHHMLSTYYRAADVCVVPSRSESFGLVAAEAMACGTPVVATAVGGLTTLVDDGVTGLLMPNRDPNAWAAALDGLIEHPLRLAAMSAAAAERGRGYTWSTTAARLRRVYSDLSRSRVPATCGVVG
jgi:D-inositol-3-phosphate glycosyltransferase